VSLATTTPHVAVGDITKTNPANPYIVEPPSCLYQVARAYLATLEDKDGRSLLRTTGEKKRELPTVFMGWNGAYWEKLDVREVRERLFKWMALQSYIKTRSQQRVRFPLTNNKILALRRMLAYVVKPWSRERCILNFWFAQTSVKCLERRYTVEGHAQPIKPATAEHLLDTLGVKTPGFGRR
jgi:hypothetical protein